MSVFLINLSVPIRIVPAPTAENGGTPDGMKEKEQQEHEK
jgi:hypothetical protein